MARELTTSWRVDYEIVADKDTADRIYAVAEELSATSTDGVSKGQFESLLNAALSIATGESVTVSTTHTTPSMTIITISTITATTSLEATYGVSLSETREARGSAYMVIGIIGGSLTVLFLAAVCLAYARHQAKFKYNRERAREERNHIILTEDDIEVDPSTRPDMSLGPRRGASDSPRRMPRAAADTSREHQHIGPQSARQSPRSGAWDMPQRSSSSAPRTSRTTSPGVSPADTRRGPRNISRSMSPTSASRSPSTIAPRTSPPNTHRSRRTPPRSTGSSNDFVRRTPPRSTGSSDDFVI
jgi:hypothetical protein